MALPVVDVVTPAPHFAHRQAKQAPLRTPQRRLHQALPGNHLTVVGCTLKPERPSRMRAVGGKCLHGSASTREATPVRGEEAHAAHEAAQAKVRGLGSEVNVQGHGATLRKAAEKDARGCAPQARHLSSHDLCQAPPCRRQCRGVPNAVAIGLGIGVPRGLFLAPWLTQIPCVWENSAQARGTVCASHPRQAPTLLQVVTTKASVAVQVDHRARVGVTPQGPYHFCVLDVLQHSAGAVCTSRCCPRCIAEASPPTPRYQRRRGGPRSCNPQSVVDALATSHGRGVAGLPQPGQERGPAGPYARHQRRTHGPRL
mmetsp:Transcript_108708/g.232274  ORF Transcript_108708/g.232274 Transcript_108708/m.232274 type:complete len:313 (+) Transcript_108708:168-1106(+)